MNAVPDHDPPHHDLSEDCSCGHDYGEHDGGRECWLCACDRFDEGGTLNKRAVPNDSRTP